MTLALLFTGNETIAELVQVLNEVSSFVGEDATIGTGGIGISLKDVERFTESPTEQKAIIEEMCGVLAKYGIASKIMG